MTYKVVRNAQGVVIAFGPIGEEYAPVTADGCMLTIEDTLPQYTLNPNDAINSQILALESSSMLNRGSREMEIYLIEKEAREYSDIYGLTMEVVLSGNSYYPKLKALDASAAILRAQLV